jgi:hypothetical protein
MTWLGFPLSFPTYANILGPRMVSCQQLNLDVGGQVQQVEG